MIRCLLIVMVTSTALLAADDPFLSLYPLHTPGNIVLDQSFEGEWDWGITVSREGTLGYRVSTSGSETLTAHLVSLDGELFVDVEWSEPLPVHVFAKVRIEKDRLVVAPLGTRELTDRLDREELAKHETITNPDNGEIEGVLLTASGSELQHFVRRCLADPEAFQKPLGLSRKEPASDRTQ